MRIWTVMDASGVVIGACVGEGETDDNLSVWLGRMHDCPGRTVRLVEAEAVTIGAGLPEASLILV